MKSILASIILITTALNLSAQNHLIGLQTGINITDASTSNFPSKGFRTGINAGVSYEYRVRNYFSVGADLIYAQRGFTSTVPFINSNGYITGPNARSQFNYDYISLPIKASYRLGENFFGFANLGVIPSILVDAHTIVENMNTGQIESYGQIDRVNKFDLAGLLELGAGYKFFQDRYWFFVSAGYQRSFTNTTTTHYFSEVEMFHYGFTFYLGLKYAFGK